MKYKVLEGITTADVAYEVYGKTLEELFQNAALAVEQTMVDITTVRPLLNSKFKIQNSKLENLLLDYLNNLVFLKDAKQMLFSRFDIKINKLDARPASPTGGRYQLDANLWGEKIDPKKHKLRTDVKAVTKHKFFLKRLRRLANKYIARVVLDI